MMFSLAWSSSNEMAEVQAFPAHLAGTVRDLVLLLARDQMHVPLLHVETVISVCFAKEALRIPYRVYYNKQQLLNCVNSAGDIGLIARCLGTRHCDGFLREQCLRGLLVADARWTVPFVLQLLGEYVVEITHFIEARFLVEIEGRYLDFFDENAKYCEYLEHRAISYWNEYYRSRFPRHKDFPAVKALALLKAASRKRASMMR